MGKGAAILGLLLIIVGLMPIWASFVAAYIDLSQFLVYFNQNIFSIPLGEYLFTEVMLALVGIGVILLLVGATR